MPILCFIKTSKVYIKEQLWLCLYSTYNSSIIYVKYKHIEKLVLINSLILKFFISYPNHMTHIATNHSQFLLQSNIWNVNKRYILKRIWIRYSLDETQCRSSHRMCSIKKVILGNFAKIHRKTPVPETLF